MGLPPPIAGSRPATNVHHALLFGLLEFSELDCVFLR